MATNRSTLKRKINLRDSEAVAFINDLDRLIREGKAETARQRLRALNTRSIPRSHAATLANTCRRVGLPMLSLRITTPVVRPLTDLGAPANEREWAIHAAALARIGVADEAQKILGSLDAEKNPEILFYQCHIYLYRWAYAKAIPILRRYIAADGITEYQRLVGKMNLAASYVALRDSRKSEPLLRELREITLARGNRLLLGNALELSAQLAISIGDFESAEENLRASSYMLKDDIGIYEFYVRKWRAVLNLLRASRCASGSGEMIEAKRALDLVRNEGPRWHDWETIRDCDLYEALATKDDTLFAYVWHGSPFSGYRTRSIRLYGRETCVSREHVWAPFDRLNKPVRVFNLAEAHEEGNPRIALKPDQLPHRLLMLLSRDYYRPMHVGEIHSHLFGSQPFDPVNSSQRIAQIVFRLRGWFREHQIPLRIDIDANEYRLSAVGSYGLRVSTRKRCLHSYHHQLKVLRMVLGSRAFSIRDVGRELEISARSARRLLAWARRARSLSGSGATRVVREGRGRGARFRFSMNPVGTI